MSVKLGSGVAEAPRASPPPGPRVHSPPRLPMAAWPSALAPLGFGAAALAPSPECALCATEALLAHSRASMRAPFAAHGAGVAPIPGAPGGPTTPGGGLTLDAAFGAGGQFGAGNASEDDADGEGDDDDEGGDAFE